MPSNLTAEQLVARTNNNTLMLQLMDAEPDTLFAVWAGFEPLNEEQLGGERGRLQMILDILRSYTVVLDPNSDNTRAMAMVARLRNNGFKVP